MPRASTAPGDCCAGLAKAAVFPLLQHTFEKDPEGYSFTLTLGLQGLEAKCYTSYPGISLAECDQYHYRTGNKDQWQQPSPLERRSSVHVLLN